MRRIAFVASIILLTMVAPASAWAACENGYVGLTYDDGLTPLTRSYVNALTARGAKATFFTVGNNVVARPSDAKYAFQKGMRIENHTQTHPNLLEWDLDGKYWEMKDQMDSVAAAGVTAQETLFRPPYGNSDGDVWNTAYGLGLRETKWTIDTVDWETPAPTAATVASRALNGVQNQSIILMHDGYQHTKNAIPTILSGLSSRKLCAGKIVPSWTNPVNDIWGFPMWVNVVRF